MDSISKVLVFISYSHSDKAFAAAFAERLKRAGVPHFIDVESIDWGEDIPDRIHEALEQSTHLVVLISPGSEQSQWVAYEMGYGRGSSKVLVPYLLHPSMRLPGFISSKRCLKSAKEERKFISRLQRLLKSSAKPKAKVSRPRETTTGPPEEQEPTIEDRLSSESGSVRRKAAIDLGNRAESGSVDALVGLLEREEDQNVRESAIKSLGKIGGSRAVALLESIWSGSEQSRYGKLAAKNALVKLGCWGKGVPLVTPDDMKTRFAGLYTAYVDTDHVRDREPEDLHREVAGTLQSSFVSKGYSLARNPIVDKEISVEGFKVSWKIERLPQQWYYRIFYECHVKALDLADRFLSWRPTEATKVAVKTTQRASILKAVQKAKDRGLSLELVLDDEIRVSGTSWPGVERQLKESYGGTLSIDLRVGRTGCKISTEDIPWEVRGTWSDCTSLLMRLARWLAG